MLCGLAYGLTLAPGVTWANSAADSGDLITAALVGGVAHPTGYPTYLLLARLFLLLPLPDPAIKVTLLSAVAATLASLVLWALLREWPATRGWPDEVAALLAALGLALAPLFWSQAVVAEVYSLNVLLVALLLWAALRAVAAPNASNRRAAAVLAGLALGNHLTVLPAVLVWLVAAWRGQEGGRVGEQESERAREQEGKRAKGQAKRLAGARLSRLVSLLGWLGVGLLVYVYLPLSALGTPPVSWGAPLNWQGFWWLASGQLYAGMAFALPPALLGERVVAWARLLVEQFGWAGVALACVGLLYGNHARRKELAITILLAGLYSLFAIGYNSADSQVYLLPVYLLFAFWIGLGIAELLRRVEPRLAPLATIALATLLLAPAILNAGRVDASRDRRAISYATTVLAQAPNAALVFAGDDRSSFPLWYYHFGLGQRPDLRIVVAPLLGFDWYRAGLQQNYPDLALPREAGDWEATLRERWRSRGPFCRASATATPLVCEP